jgi:uncharacterized membrane protein YozB (DUF420 family)
MNHINLQGPSSTISKIMANSRRLAFASAYIFAAYTALRGISESVDNEGFPEALTLKLDHLPIVFPVHMVTGGLALLLVPLVLVLRGTRWHKIVGRIAAVDIAIAGVTAIPVALQSPVTRVSALGFTAQGLTWLVLLGLGLWHIRNHRYEQHRNAMLMMAAVTTGALFFRIYLGLWKVYGSPTQFDTFYAVNAWVAWGVPLAITALWVSRLSKSHP